MTDTAGTDSGPCRCGPCLARAQTKHVRTWRWITSLDLTKPPAPVLRYIGILVVALIYLGLGAPTQLGDWLWAASIVGFLILPDVAGFAVAGVRLDLKQAQDAIATLRQDVNAQARASSIAGVAIGNDAIAAWTDALIRAARQANSDQASGAAAPWPPSGSGTKAQQSTARPDGT
jgi:hypothetical protein